MKIEYAYYLAIFAIVLGTSYLHMTAHEEAHAKACEYYGSNASITYETIFGFPYHGETTCLDPLTNINGKTAFDARNEETSYPLYPLAIGIILALFTTGAFVYAQIKEYENYIDETQNK
jgi:heme/copper-type cytochrome/quinol oxidase subunit 3